MATRINVIIASGCVYATYVQTICYKEKYSNDEEMYTAIKNAKYTAFDYACSFGSVLANVLTRPDLKTDADIFEYIGNNI